MSKKGIAERLSILIDYFEEGNQQQFAKKIKVSKGSIHRVYTGGKDPGGKVLAQTLEYFSDVRAEWLMRGDGEMLVKKNEQVELKEPVVTYNSRVDEFIYTRLIEQVGQLQAMIDQLEKDIKNKPRINE